MTIKVADLVLPDEIASTVWQKASEQSVVAALGAGEPQQFGAKQEMVIEGKPRGQYVKASGEKSSSEVEAKWVSTVREKVQVTIRYEKEVEWADEATKADIVGTFASLLPEALARALDIGVIHGVDPLSGAQIPDLEQYITKGASRLTVPADDADIQAQLDQLEALVTSADYIPSAIGLDARFAGAVRGLRNPTTKARQYPELALRGASTLEGMLAMVSTAVSGRPEISPDSGIRAILGDWSAVRWGVQKAVPIEIIRYGDPDGKGDLQRLNQVALRAEVVYGWRIMDPLAFAILLMQQAGG